MMPVSAQSAAGTQKSLRQVAVTFDDLPGVALPEGFRCNLDSLKDISRMLLATAADYQMPAAGLVVEGRGCESFDDQSLTELYEIWLKAGAILGNHTYSHIDLNNTPPEEYQADILKGENQLMPTLKKYGQSEKYFRYPYLHAGNTPESKKAIETFLNANDYIMAPVTIDNQEWVFARVYSRAYNRGDTETMQKISDAYVPYMATMFEYFESISMALFGREIPQILLLHVNLINAHHLGALAEMMKKRGYQFISMKTALEDPAYQTPNGYIGNSGISWLLRWAGDRNIEVPAEPREPEWVGELFRNNTN